MAGFFQNRSQPRPEVRLFHVSPCGWKGTVYLTWMSISCPGCPVNREQQPKARKCRRDSAEGRAEAENGRRRLSPETRGQVSPGGPVLPLPHTRWHCELTDLRTRPAARDVSEKHRGVSSLQGATV